MKVKCWKCNGTGAVDLIHNHQFVKSMCENCKGMGVLELEIIDERSYGCEGCPHDYLCGCGLGYDDETCCPHYKS